MSRGFALFAVTACAFAQDPYKLLPKNYSVELDNPYVRVSRVKYSPGERLPEHSHPSIPTVYVYLTDGGPIRFVHKTPKFELDDPPSRPEAFASTATPRSRLMRSSIAETRAPNTCGSELKTTPGPPHISRMREALPALSNPSVLVDVARRGFTWFDPKQGRPGLRRRV